MIIPICFLAILSTNNLTMGWSDFKKRAYIDNSKQALNIITRY